MPISVSIKITVPKEKFKDKKWVESVERTMKREVVSELLFDFEKTIRGWKLINNSRPVFRGKLISNSQRIAMEVTVFGNSKASRVYRILNLGAPKHDIPAKKGRILRYQRGYMSATNPGSLIGGSSYRFGEWRTAKKVDHPGLEARKFDALIAKDYEPNFTRHMQADFDKAAKG